LPASYMARLLLRCSAPLGWQSFAPPRDVDWPLKGR
jgi:hypothetical protein